MNCQSMEKNLIAYLDGKAGVAERRKVEAHLGECAECRERAEQFRLLWGVLDEWPAPPISSNFDAAVLGARGAATCAQRFLGVACAFAASGVCADGRRAPFCVALLDAAEPSRAGRGRSDADSGESDFNMIEDLPALEDYDVISNFDALSDLPANPAPQAQGQPSL